MFGKLLNSARASNRTKDPFEEDFLKNIDKNALRYIPNHFTDIYNDWRDFEESADTLNGKNTNCSIIHH